MHRSSYLRMEYLLKYYSCYWRKKEFISVLDIGSYDMNGSYKALFSSDQYRYTGLDMVEGPNVDVVPKNIYSWDEFKSESFDLVISGQAFEHVEYPWLTIREIERVLKPSGFCFITAPNAGKEHKTPTDCYRYFADGFRALAKWANLTVHSVAIAGVPDYPASDEWFSDWNDATLVAQKAPATKVTRPDPFQWEMHYGMDGEAIYLPHIDALNRRLENIIHQAPDKKVALFGAEYVGRQIVDLLGSEKVHYFVDNDIQKIGTYTKGKEVISLDQFSKISDDYLCIISASFNASKEIKKQLERCNITCFTLYPQI